MPEVCGKPEEQTGPHPEGSESQDSCAVCLDEFKATEKEGIWSTSCQHRFHANCLRDHFKTQQNRRLQETCPICRTALPEEAKILSPLEENLILELDTQQANLQPPPGLSIVIGLITLFVVAVIIYGCV